MKDLSCDHALGRVQNRLAAMTDRTAGSQAITDEHQIVVENWISTHRDINQDATVITVTNHHFVVKVDSFVQLPYVVAQLCQCSTSRIRDYVPMVDRHGGRTLRVTRAAPVTRPSSRTLPPPRVHPVVIWFTGSFRVAP